MFIIDSHVHLYPEEVNRDPAAWAAAQGEEHWARLCTRTRDDGRPVQGFPDVDTLLRSMDAAGVDHAVLLGWYWEHAASCTMQNRFYAECVRAHPDRLSAFATVRPDADGSDLAELRRARDAGLIGLGELSPHTQHVYPGDPGLAALLELAGKLGLPVNLHVSDPSSPAYPGRKDTPLADFERLARDHPDTIFILAHWGGGLDVRQLPNVWVDTAASPLIYGLKGWTHIGRTVAMERVLFGTDHPLNLYPRLHPAPEFGSFIEEARAQLADPDGRESVLGGNAVRLLNLPRL